MLIWKTKLMRLSVRCKSKWRWIILIRQLLEICLLRWISLQSFWSLNPTIVSHRCWVWMSRWIWSLSRARVRSRSWWIKLRLRIRNSKTLKRIWWWRVRGRLRFLRSRSKLQWGLKSFNLNSFKPNQWLNN